MRCPPAGYLRVVKFCYNLSRSSATLRWRSPCRSSASPGFFGVDLRQQILKGACAAGRVNTATHLAPGDSAFQRRTPGANPLSISSTPSIIQTTQQLSCADLDGKRAPQDRSRSGILPSVQGDQCGGQQRLRQPLVRTAYVLSGRNATPSVVSKCSILVQSMPCLSTLFVYKKVASTFCVSNNKLGHFARGDQ